MQEEFLYSYLLGDAAIRIACILDATFGKVLKKAPEDYTDVKSQVIADYQDMLEKEWVTALRKKYPVVVNKDVLATVNKH